MKIFKLILIDHFKVFINVVNIYYILLGEYKEMVL